MEKSFSAQDRDLLTKKSDVTTASKVSILQNVFAEI